MVLVYTAKTTATYIPVVLYSLLCVDVRSGEWAASTAGHIVPSSCVDCSVVVKEPLVRSEYDS